MPKIKLGIQREIDAPLSSTNSRWRSPASAGTRNGPISSTVNSGVIMTRLGGGER